MAGPYIVNGQPNNNKVRRLGKNLKIDRSPSGGYSEFNIEHMSRGKINNLVFSSNQKFEVKHFCTVCQQRCELMTKQALIDSYSNLHNESAESSIQRIQQECEDNETYAVCKHCGKIHTNTETQIVPRNPKAKFQCVKCQFSEENQGRVKTLTPTKMHEIRNDPNSPKHWYWSCSLCSHRYPMENSNLKIQVAEEGHSFVKSKESESKPSGITKEDYQDLAGLGTPTRLVDSKDTPPPI